MLEGQGSEAQLASSGSGPRGRRASGRGRANGEFIRSTDGIGVASGSSSNRTPGSSHVHRAAGATAAEIWGSSWPPATGSRRERSKGGIDSGGTSCRVGFLASRLATGHGYGVVGDIVVGVIGALIGAFVLGRFITDHSLVAQIIVAFIGAVILLAVLRLFAGGMGRRRRDGRRSHERRGTGRRFFGRRYFGRRT